MAFISHKRLLLIFRVDTILSDIWHKASLMNVPGIIQTRLTYLYNQFYQFATFV